MQHEVPTDQLGPTGPAMTEAIQACVHCGFCLPACPTYQELGQEMDSPRGRIFLMKEVLENRLDPKEAEPHIDRCLGCLACEPACPSGVPYRNLISPFRAWQEARRQRSLVDRLKRTLLLETLPFAGRFRWGAKLGSLMRPLRGVLPAAVRPMLDLLPDRLPPRQRLPLNCPVPGRPVARVALLSGCAQQVLAPEINAATLKVLHHLGVEVVIPEEQGCCGALAWHIGDQPRAQASALKNVKAFPESLEVGAVLTNAAGCGSGMHEYGLILKGHPEEAGGQALADKTMDVSVYLQRLDLAKIPALKKPLKVVYQDACHLNHGQGVQAAPRQLLSAIPGVELLDVSDPHLCCGSAGSYNIDQPELAFQLGDAKAKALIETGADVVATGNIGCLTQLRVHLERLDSPMKVRHTIEILADALPE